MSRKWNQSKKQILYPRSENVNVPVPKQLELFKEYELIEQDGYITVYPDLLALSESKNRGFTYTT